MSGEQNTYGTPFEESEALMAVMNDDAAHALGVLRDMLPSELRTFEKDLLRLRDLARMARREQRKEEP